MTAHTATLITKLKAKLARVENMSAKGVDRAAAFEIAEFSGLATQLRWAGEEELEANERAESDRHRRARDAASAEVQG
jgi:hypothetical protein